MFILRESYGRSWRVFIPDSTIFQRKQVLKSLSIWGGHDKVEVFNNTKFVGYEFSSLEMAYKAMEACLKA